MYIDDLSYKSDNVCSIVACKSIEIATHAVIKSLTIISRQQIQPARPTWTMLVGKSLHRMAVLSKVLEHGASTAVMGHGQGVKI
jgi:hypothetical protein